MIPRTCAPPPTPPPPSARACYLVSVLFIILSLIHPHNVVFFFFFSTLTPLSFILFISFSTSPRDYIFPRVGLWLTLIKFLQLSLRRREWRKGVGGGAGFFCITRPARPRTGSRRNRARIIRRISRGIIVSRACRVP